jgi:glutamine amidotransferase
MSASVVVVDYGIGNVFSVCNALKKAGLEPNLTRDVTDIKNADRLLLPGVGAFGKAIDALVDLGFDDMIRTYVETGRPFLGICIGMQLLMDEATEFGNHKGLGLIPGKVDRIPDCSTKGEMLRIPHISWAKVTPPSGDAKTAWSGSPLEVASTGHSDFYFVHSYHAVPSDPAHIHAVVDYGGNSVTAAVRRDNIFGTQFHPERSGPLGLQVLGQFASL